MSTAWQTAESLAQRASDKLHKAAFEVQPLPPGGDVARYIRNLDRIVADIETAVALAQRAAVNYVKATSGDEDEDED